jgi:Transposase and inactivated derivatives
MANSSKPDLKLLALAESGTVNPHAQDVQDVAFIGSDFFDARDLVQVRYEMLRRVRSEGQSIADIATRFGVSRPTFYKVQADFERAGLVGLLPAKRGPHGPHKITAEVMAFIETVRTQEEGLEAQVLVERIAQRFGLAVHRRTVERALARSKKNAHESRCDDRGPHPGRALRVLAAGRGRVVRAHCARARAADVQRDGGLDALRERHRPKSNARRFAK